MPQSWDSGSQAWDSATQSWGSGGERWYVDIDPSGMEPGDWTLEFLASDTEGNDGTSDTVGFTIVGSTYVYPHWPTIRVEVKFVEDWITVATVTGFSTQRGRTSELESFSAGTATVHVDDVERYYDVDNLDSPYIDGLIYNRPIRIVAVWAGITYPVWSGFTDQWGPPRSGALDYAELDITATDAFKKLNRKITAAIPFTLGDPVCGVLGVASLPGIPTFTEQLRTGELITRVLDLIGWPTDARRIDNGQTNCLEHKPDKNVLEYIQQLERSEAGRFFVGADGALEFHQRRGISRDVQVVASDVPLFFDTLYYENDYEFDPSSRATIKNRVVRNNGERTATRQDAASIAQYDLAEDSQDVLTADADELDSQCRYYLKRYKTPAPRITKISFSPEQNPSFVWPHVLGRQIGERVAVIRTPHPDATPVTGYYTIESIGHDVDGASKQWRCTWGLAPSPDEPGLFTLGSSVLGGTDVLAY